MYNLSVAQNHANMTTHGYGTMINQIKNALPSRNIVEASEYPISIYDEHVTMMTIKWTTSGTMRLATMNMIEHENDHEGDAPNEH
jgi:type I restriction-modification system DNA methylase subunit